MKIYLVGGAVRDQLLGLPVKERDWVVVGATVDDMLALGYRQVGKDFPVFLHPETKEEYALARTERKIGRGYTGFSFDTSTHVTLEEDLKRRDITINAMAETEQGDLIDPYHGKTDLEKRVLRHVSEAFAEDPVRILRIARFAARFATQGFTIATETMTLMKQMVQAGEVDALVAERVWKEWERALSEQHPEVFFQTLMACGAAEILFPSPILSEKTTFRLIKAVTLSQDPKVRFAVLLAEQSEQNIMNLCDRYRVPSEYRDLVLLVARYLSDYQAASLTVEQVLALLQSTDAFRREERFHSFLQTAEIVTKMPHSRKKLLLECLTEAKQMNAKEFLHLPGKEIALKIAEQRKKAIQQVLHRNS